MQRKRNKKKIEIKKSKLKRINPILARIIFAVFVVLLVGGLFIIASFFKSKAKELRENGPNSLVVETKAANYTNSTNKTSQVVNYTGIIENRTSNPD